MSTATIDNLISQMSKGQSVLNKWDVVLNMDESLVNKLFQFQFEHSDKANWKEIVIAFCQSFPDPDSDGKLAAYTRTKISLAKPSLKFLGNNQAFVEVHFDATGSTGTAGMKVPKDFNPKTDCDPTNPALDWTDTDFTSAEFTGKVPISSIDGQQTIDGDVTQFVLDFTNGSFTGAFIDDVKDPSELKSRIKNYLVVNKVSYVLNSIKTDLLDQIPQMAPKSFKINVLTTNTGKNVFQIFVASENPAQSNTSINVNEPIPDEYELSFMFNKSIVDELHSSLMVQAFLFLQSNLLFPGFSNLSLGPQFTPFDALILGKLEINDSSIKINTNNNQNNPIMLNIQNTRQISPANQGEITIYGDDQNPKAWYVPPSITFAKDANGVPKFTLIKTTNTGGKISGFCRFEIQLHIDDSRKKAVLAQIPDATFPQFDWIKSKVAFTYTIDGVSTTISGKPSNYGQQKTMFSIPLADEKAVKAFINAFSPSGSQGGTFAIDFDLAANTRLPAVTVRTKFDSKIAYQYQVKNKFKTEQRYHTDTWGHKTVSNVQVYIGSYVTEMLTQSKSGKVEVTPGQGLTPGLLDMITKWANKQLANDVQESVSTALKLIKNPTNDFSMNSVASFSNVLSTTNVVPWYIDVQSSITPFDATTWQKVYSEISQQRLVTAFDIQEDLKALEVDRVNLTFVYGTNQPLTHTFNQTNQDSWSLDLAGLFNGDSFEDKFKYKYDVIYSAVNGNQPPPLSTDWIESNLTSVNLGSVELGLMAITFTASNIDWSSGTAGSDDNSSPDVKEITVDWNWLPGNGNQILNKTLILTKENPSVKSALRSISPTNNQVYQYSLTFLMDDGTKLHANGLQGTEQFQNINHPLSEVTFSVMPTFDTVPKMLVLKATFDDEKNGIHQSKQWSVRKGSDGELGEFKDWNFKAVVKNLNTTTIVTSGVYVDDKNKQHVIPKNLTIGTGSILMPSDTQKTVTAVVDASNVDFKAAQVDGVYRVVANVGSTTSGDATIPAEIPNATTLTFDKNQNPVQYVPTNPIDIDKTPDFVFQYVFTEVENSGARTKVTNNFATNQKTQSTALPVIPGKPAAGTPNLQLGTEKGISPRMVISEGVLDLRTKSLFDKHDLVQDEHSMKEDY